MVLPEILEYLLCGQKDKISLIRRESGMSDVVSYEAIFFFILRCIA